MDLESGQELHRIIIQIMFWRIALGLVKSVTLLALFGFVNRVAAPTGLHTAVIDPVASAISHVSGVPVNYSILLMIGVTAVGLFKVLIALARAAAATIRR
jgi:hypothetical protein